MPPITLPVMTRRFRSACSLRPIAATVETYRPGHYGGTPPDRPDAVASAERRSAATRSAAAAHFASTDDVVFSNGIAYVADNGGGTMSAVTLASGTVNTLVTGVKAAQGLAMRADGTFLVVDEKSGDIRVATGC